jgi:hypothetical protein
MGQTVLKVRRVKLAQLVELAVLVQTDQMGQTVLKVRRVKLAQLVELAVLVVLEAQAPKVRRVKLAQLDHKEDHLHSQQCILRGSEPLAVVDCISKAMVAVGT